MKSAVWYSSMLVVVAITCMQQVQARKTCQKKGLYCQDDEFCCDSHSMCCKLNGAVCCPSGMVPGCCYTNFPVCCPNMNKCCATGYPVCCQGSNTCCSEQYPVCCNGWCCQKGAHCCGGKGRSNIHTKQISGIDGPKRTQRTWWI